MWVLVGGVFSFPGIARADFTSDITGVGSGKCLDVEGNSQSDGANVIQWTCHGGANQSVFFRLVVPTVDTYELAFSHSGRCMTVTGTATGANIVQRACTGGTDQQFRLVADAAANTYKLESVHSNLVVEVAGGSVDNLANIQQGTDIGSNGQLFTLKSTAPANGTPDAATYGSWEPLIVWPHIAVSMALLPNGQVLTWSGSERETWPRAEQTYTAVWDPTTNTFNEVFTLGHNMFCANQVMMADGRVFANGGRNGVNTPFVSVFDWRTATWESFEPMASGGRWYPTTIALADGDVYTAMGTASNQRTPERWDPRDGWQLQPGTDFGPMVLNPYPDSSHGERRWWPLLHVAPNGKLIHSGPTPDMHWINTTGLGDYEQTGPQWNSWYHKHGITVMYEEGKILTAGGWTAGKNIKSVADAFTVDVNGPAPDVKLTDPMNFPRKFHVAVMLPTGEVMAVGGNTSGRKFSDDGGVLDVEFWDPATETWSIGAPMTVPRGYHSTGTLLLDGRVLSAGGGYCSGSRTCNGSSHKDGQVYSPPYLFDANGDPAERPSLTSAPSTLIPGESVTVEADEAIDYFSLVKMSSNTHGMNTDLRYLRIPSTLVNGTTYELSPHANPNVLTPGYWILFGINADGVPSEGVAVQVITTESEYENLALSGTVSMSSTATGTPSLDAANAIDGDMAGEIGSGAMARTDEEEDPYWEVDLRHSAEITSVRVWNRTDCCESELENFSVFISKEPFTSSGFADTMAQSDVVEFSVSSRVDRLLEIDIGETGRYVRIQREGTHRLTLAEVQVFGQDNLALAGLATQSSQFGTVAQFGPENAIDGTRVGTASSNSITHTLAEPEAWWELDLGADSDIEEIVLWNRTDCCTTRLSNFDVFVSSDPFTSTSRMDTRNQPGVSTYTYTSLSGPSVTVPVGHLGRYIRVQLSGSESLSLAEVEVHGLRNRLEVDTFDTRPQLVDTTVFYGTSGTGTPPIEYNWDFGDGTSTGYSTSPSASHTYTEPGRYVVTLQVRDGAGDDRTLFANQLVHRPLTSRPPSASSSIIVEGPAGSSRVWNVNPDNDSVNVAFQDGTPIGEIFVGHGPWSLAKAPLRDEVWVANKKDGTISVIDTALLSVSHTIDLGAGSQPHGVAFAPLSNRVYVALEATGELVRFDAATKNIDAAVNIGGRVRHLSVNSTGDKVYVSRFVTPPLPFEDTLSPVVSDSNGIYGGHVVVLSGGLTPLTTAVLQHSDRAASEHSGPGLPNYLGPAVISPDGSHAWVPSKQDNVLSGGARGNIGMTFDQTVRAISSAIDLTTDLEDFNLRVDHDNASVATHAAFGPYGAYLFTALEGNRQVAVSDTFTGVEVMRFNVGRAPEGLAVSEDGRMLFVHNFMDRTVGVYDLSPLVDGDQMSVTQVTEFPTTAFESLAPDVFVGKQFFYDAADDRLALDDYMSCASCHNQGGQDGRVWDFSSFGEGLRNTIALNGRGDPDNGIIHWSGNFDEIQDFENQIRGFAGGTGLMNDADFLATEPLLGAPKAGLSPELDALAAYMASLEEYPASPYKPVSGGFSSAADSGRELFYREGCVGCHAGPALTDSGYGLRHDVGTMSLTSGGRMGGVLDGIDTPTLRDAWLTPPYLHDGSAATLEDAIARHSGVNLSSAELSELATYLEELETADMGVVTTDEVIRSLSFSVFDDPIAVFGPNTFEGSDPSTTRVSSLSSAGLDYRLQEYDYLDGPHQLEAVGYLVVEQNQTRLGGLAAESSSMLLREGWTTVQFANPFPVAPVVLAQVVSEVESSAVTPRIRNVTTTDFQIRLQEEEAADGVHAYELVHWIAVEPGSTSVLGRPVFVQRTGRDRRHRWSTITFPQTFFNPVFLANIQSFYGGDTAGLRIRQLTGASVQVKVEEEKSRDNEMGHVEEVIGFIVIGD